MKSVCYNLCVGEQTLYQVPEGGAQIHADYLYILPASELPQVAFQYRRALIFKDFIDAVMPQIC